jgi:hypothetical protein
MVAVSIWVRIILRVSTRENLPSSDLWPTNTYLSHLINRHEVEHFVTDIDSCMHVGFPNDSCREWFLISMWIRLVGHSYRAGLYYEIMSRTGTKTHHSLGP